MKRVVALLLAMAVSAQAAAPPRGDDRLRELVVFPEMRLNFVFGLVFQDNTWGINQNEDAPAEINRLHKVLAQQPEDISGRLHLGDLLADNGKTNEALACYQQAGELAQKQADANPQAGLNWLVLGQVQEALGRHDEAEQNFRQATTASPNEWRCWVALGNFLANDYTHSLFPENLRPLVFASTQAPPPAALDYRPSPAALAKTIAQCGEAARCFDRAFTLAPEEPEVYFQHAGYLSVSNWQACFIRHFRDGENLPAKAWPLGFFSVETIAHLQKAAALKPKSYEYVSLAADFEWTRAGLLNQDDPASLPDDTRRSIKEAMTRLENLAGDSDPKLAAGALENLGLLNMMFGNQPVATANFRRAVALDPGRQQSWDMLLGLLRETASLEEMTGLCEARLKQDGSARNHLVLARALEHQKKWDQAREITGAALQIEPDNLTAQLELAALSLKQSSESGYLPLAAVQLATAQKTLGQISVPEDYGRAWRELTLDMAIYNGLSGNADAARMCVAALFKFNPNDEQAKAIASAMNYTHSQ